MITMVTEKKDWWLEVYDALLEETKLFDGFLTEYFHQGAEIPHPCKDVDYVKVGKPSRIALNIDLVKNQESFETRNRLIFDISNSEMVNIYSKINLILNAHENIISLIKSQLKTYEDQFIEIKKRLAPILVAKKLKE